MIKKLGMVIALSAATLIWAAASYTVNLTKPALVGSSEIKAGDYKLELNGSKVTLKHGKTEVEADVTVENGSTKFAQTTACCVGDDGKYHLQEIRIGGTNTKLTFNQTSSMAVGK